MAEFQILLLTYSVTPDEHLGQWAPKGDRLLMQTWDKPAGLWELEQTTLEHNPQQSQKFSCFEEFPGSFREGINRTSQA